MVWRGGLGVEADDAFSAAFTCQLGVDLAASVTASLGVCGVLVDPVGRGVGVPVLLGLPSGLASSVVDLHGSLRGVAGGGVLPPHMILVTPVVSVNPFVDFSFPLSDSPVSTPPLGSVFEGQAPGRDPLQLHGLHGTHRFEAPALESFEDGFEVPGPQVRLHIETVTVTVDLARPVSELQAVAAGGLTLPDPLWAEVQGDDPAQAFCALNLPLSAVLSDAVRPPGEDAPGLQDFRWSHDPEAELPKLPSCPPVEPDVPELEVEPLTGALRVHLE